MKTIIASLYLIALLATAAASDRITRMGGVVGGSPTSHTVPDFLYMGHHYKSPRVSLDVETGMIEVSDAKMKALMPRSSAPKNVQALFPVRQPVAPPELPADTIEFHSNVLTVLDDGVLLWMPDNSRRVAKVEGVTGYVDGDTVRVQAKKTDRVYKYTSADGAAKTVRVYTAQ